MASPPIRVMIAGAAKAGSTSLLAYLGQHPGLRVQRSQEMTFFRIDREYRLGYERAFRRYWGRVEEDGGAILAKNAGMMYSPEALDRLWWHNPDTVLLISLRDPAERAFSHYWHSRGGGREPLERFEEAMAAESLRLARGANPAIFGYMEWSQYARHLREVYRRFPADQVHVTTPAEFRRGTSEAIRAVFAAAGVDPDFEIDVMRRHNTRAMARSLVLAKIADPTSRLSPLIRKVVPAGPRRRIARSVRLFNRRPAEVTPMSSAARRELDERFAAMKVEVEEMVGRQLDW